MENEKRQSVNIRKKLMVNKLLVGTALLVAMATGYAVYQPISEIETTEKLALKVLSKESSLDTAYKLYTDCLVAQYMTLESKIYEMVPNMVNDFAIKSNDLCVEWTEVWISEEAGVPTLTPQEIVEFNSYRIDRILELKESLLSNLKELDKQRKLR